MKKIAELIKKNCDNINSVFVFPLQVQAREWFIRSLDITGKSALPESMFISWQNFKKNFFESDEKLTPISQSIRKIFSEYILAQNALSAKKEKAIFKKIILENYAETSKNFSSWLVNILPQLDNFERKLKENNYYSDDAKDFLVLKKYYENFMSRFALYEPAWAGKKLKLKDENIKIIFPELIEDFYELREAISKASNIELITAFDFFDKEKSIEAIEFENSRHEIDFCISSIEKLLLDGIPANEIAVTVFDIDEIKAYIKREADLRSIPIEFRSGEQLGKTQAGKLFKQILEVANSHYSFDSLNELFLNPHLPWKHIDVMRKLLQFGIDYNCVCSWQEKNRWKNIWEEAFKLNDSNKSIEQLRLEDFFAELKLNINAIIRSKTFNEVRKNYSIFREKFFDIKNISTADDLILSRCIEKLKDLNTLEKNFSKLLPKNRFRFFVDELEQTNYVYQNTGTAVSIFPEKVMAISPFKYNFILNVNQSSAKIMYQNLLFLRADIRKNLNAKDIDASALFLRSYANCENAKISFSSKTFSNYAICHTALEARTLNDCEKEILKENSFVSEEKYFYKEECEAGKTFTVYPIQVSATKAFVEKFKHEKNFSFLQRAFPKKIHSSLLSQIKKRNYIVDELLKISQSQLKVFAECPAKYFFNNILCIQKNANATLLFPMDLGNLSHTILKNLFLKISESTGVLLASKKKLYESFLSEIIKEQIIRNKDLNRAFRKFLYAKNFIEIKALLDYVIDRYEDLSIPIIETSLVEKRDRYILEGTLDCALYDTKNKKFKLFDFKTNAVPTKSLARISKEGASLGDFQMALYVFLLESEYSSAKVDSATFWSLNKAVAVNIIDETDAVKSFSRDGFDASIDDLFLQLDNFANHLYEYDFSKAPNVLFNQCLACDYKNICRTTFQVDGE